MQISTADTKAKYNYNLNLIKKSNSQAYPTAKTTDPDRPSEFTSEFFKQLHI